MFPTLTRDEVFRIETRRLWLRWPRAEDAIGMAAWVGKPEVATMTSSFRVGMTETEIAARLELARASNTEGRGLRFTIVPQGADDTAVGMVGVGFKPDGKLELGYHLDPVHWGRGLMSEAVTGLAAQVFELTSAAKIDASVQPHNAASIRVLEKCGFVCSGGGEHESTVHGRHLVRHYALARSRPSALLSAYQRSNAVPELAHELVGLV